MECVGNNVFSCATLQGPSRVALPMAHLHTMQLSGTAPAGLGASRTRCLKNRVQCTQPGASLQRMRSGTVVCPQPATPASLQRSLVIGVSPALRNQAARSSSSRARILAAAASSAYPSQQGSAEHAQPPGKAGSGDASSSKDGSLGFKRSLWAFIDVVAIFGSVGGAVAALLGIGPTSYVLALPMVLPLLSLVAALNREGLIAEVRQNLLHQQAIMPHA